MSFLWFFNDTASTEIYTSCHTLSLHAALPISYSIIGVVADNQFYSLKAVTRPEIYFFYPAYTDVLTVSYQGSAEALMARSEEQTSELQSLMRTSYSVFCLIKQKHTTDRKHSYTCFD